ncbi:MAG: glycosyltransferase family 4 protein [Methylococcaceae bacterium]|nr:glycosyltransferase family 4 protein [Methylococcaceae bacterium]
MSVAWIGVMAGLLTWFFTGVLRRYAIAKSLIDIPNARSSHTVATPRGGGVAMVVVFLVSQLLLFRAGLLSASVLLALTGSGVVIAITGFLDDHQHIAARWRLLIHFGASAWGLYWLGGLPSLSFFGWDINLGWLGHGLGLFYLVWLLNLYNFMDGIDGIASIEAVTVCLGGALLTMQGYELSGQGWELVLLAIIVSGFLIWNFPPAKIFMGDAGSGFLGMVLGLFSIQAGWMASQLFWSWLILLGVFIVDATVTLFRRLLCHEKLHEAHCSHAYQNASRIYLAHKPVSLAVAAINLCWLIPIALWVGLGKFDGILGLLLAYLPLVLLAVYFKAGIRNIG